MSDSLIVEILLAVLAAAVGVASYLGSSRASKAQAVATLADVDAEAYDRAKGIYESAIKSLEGHVARLREQITLLDAQITQLTQSNADLQRSNAELRLQLTELQLANARLQVEVNQFKKDHGYE